MEDAAYTMRWLSAFLFTAAVEVPVVILLLRSTGKPVWRLLILAIVAQCASHPAVWFIFPTLGLKYWNMILVAESWAVLSETVIYFGLNDKVKLSRALLVSLFANGMSYGFGLASQIAARHYNLTVF